MVFENNDNVSDDAMIPITITNCDDEDDVRPLSESSNIKLRKAFERGENYKALQVSNLLDELFIGEEIGILVGNSLIGRINKGKLIELIRSN